MEQTLTGRPCPQPSSTTDRPASLGAEGLFARYACGGRVVGMTGDHNPEKMRASSDCKQVGVCVRAVSGVRAVGRFLVSTRTTRSTAHSHSLRPPEKSTGESVQGGAGPQTFELSVHSKWNCRLSSPIALTLVLSGHEVCAADVLAQHGSRPGHCRPISLRCGGQSRSRSV